jgi:hypothetical protein
MSRKFIFIATTTVSTLVCFALFMGFMFGLVYPEIRLNTVFITSVCNITATSLGAKTCCSKSCNLGCSTANSLAPACSSLLSSLTPGDCGDGVYCCATSCSTCQSCSQTCNSKGCTTSCYPYSCNCFCSSSTSNRACTVNCATCYTPTATYQYLTVDGQTETFVESQSCGQDLGCAQQFVAARPVNGSRQCYYDPLNFQNVDFARGYSAGPFVAIAFPSLYFVCLFIFGLVLLIRYLFNKITDNCRLPSHLPVVHISTPKEMANMAFPQTVQDDFVTPKPPSAPYESESSGSESLSNECENDTKIPIPPMTNAPPPYYGSSDSMLQPNPSYFGMPPSGI